MKWNIFVLFSTLVFLFSCEGHEKTRLPEDFISRATYLLDQSEEDEYSRGVQLKFSHIDWTKDTIPATDSTPIFVPFDLVYLKNEQEQPWSYRAIIQEDTIADIQRFNYLFRNYQTILPYRFHINFDEWWVELFKSKPAVDTITSDYRKFEEIGESTRRWKAVFYGNVEAHFENNILKTDTLIWNYLKDRMEARYVEVNYGGEIIRGLGLEAPDDFSEFEIFEPLGTVSLEDSDP